MARTIAPLTIALAATLWLSPSPSMAVRYVGQVAGTFQGKLAGISSGSLEPGLLRGHAQVKRWASCFLDGRSPYLAYPDNTTVEVKLPWKSPDARPLARCDSAPHAASASTAAATGVSDSPDANLLEAVRIYCEAKLGSLTEVYVDPQFTGNHERLQGEDGWLDQAFVTYMGLRKTHDKIGAEEDLLVQSVHHFSTRPIVVVNFGDHVPKRWSPELFPNLILMHARSAARLHKSFNFNKITSMLFSKVKTGIVLDADQFVNRGFDSLFESASRETNKDYPYPIMPVHWMSRDPSSSDYQVYAFRFVSEHAPQQTQRWGHAHPTFGHHALPWLAKWASFALQPSLTQAPQWLIDQGYLEDEDLLNVALWADKATKQWCKFDIPSPNDFGNYLKQLPTTSPFKDSKYYPRGVPMVFFSAHDAKKPSESYTWLRELWKGDDKRQAILYDGQWFGSGEALHKYDPSVKCIV